MTREEVKSLEPILRGYHLSSHPISLELPLQDKKEETVDDGVRLSWAGTITGGLVTLLGTFLLAELFPSEASLLSLPFIFGPVPYIRREVQRRKEQRERINRREVQRDTYEPVERQVEEREPQNISSLTLLLPEDYGISIETVQQLLLSFRFLSYPVSFEIVGKEKEIVFQLAVDSKDIRAISSQFKASFPEAEIYREEDRLKRNLQNTPIIVDFGLDRESIRPIDCFRNLKFDPLASVVGALSHLKGEEVAGMQILFQRLKSEWTKKISKLVSLIKKDNELLKKAKEKLSRPLFATSIRVFASAKQSRSRRIIREIGASLEQYSKPSSNRFIPLEDSEYDSLLHKRDLLLRQTRRTGLVLNSKELAGLVHPPGANIKNPKLLRIKSREAMAPKNREGIRLGINTYHSKSQKVLLEKDKRNRHFYTVGATRMGKSTLLLNMIVQDIEENHGLAVIDPHGDLITELLPFIPEERVSDVIYFNALDREYPIGLNPLDIKKESEKDLVCSEILVTFKRLFGRSWGNRLEHVLRFTLLALLEASGYTLRDIMKTLNDELFREKLLEKVKVPDVVDFFRHEFPDYSSSAILPIKNKVGRFLSVSSVRNIIAQKENRMDFKKLLKEKKILLVSIPHGSLGEDNSKLLGSLIVSKLQLTAMSMVETKKEKRRNFYLYCDEFQNFMSGPSFSKILSEAGKYKLCLNMAHQYTSQLPKRVRDAVFGNVGTIVCFRVGPEDAGYLTRAFGGKFQKEDILSLSRGETFVRMGSTENAFNMKTFPSPKPPEKNFIHEIVENSRNQYAQKREEVERELFNRKGKEPKEPSEKSFRF